MTLIHEHDLGILTITVLQSERDTQTDATKSITMPHSRVAKTKKNIFQMALLMAKTCHICHFWYKMKTKIKKISRPASNSLVTSSLELTIDGKNTDEHIKGTTHGTQ